MQKFENKDIIDSLRKGDNEAVLSFLYKQVLPLVVNYVHKNKGNKEEAKDIFQDAVIIFYKKVKRNEIDENANIIGFIYQVSKNLWINRAKKKQKIQYIPEHDDYSAGENFLNDIISEERKVAVLKCFEELGDECKNLLKFSVYENLSMKEICLRMGYSSENVAKTYNYRCKQKLLQIVKKYKNVVNLVRE